MSTEAARRRRREAPILVALLLILVIAVGGWKILSDRLAPGGTEQHGHVAIPPASTTPPVVVSALIKAFNVCDHRTIRALTSANYASTALGWCNGGIHDLHVASWNDGGVSVTFKERHGDGSLPGGMVYWDFMVDRSPDGTRWVVTTDGATGS